MVFIDRLTRQRFISAKHVGDIVIDARSNSNTLNVDIVPVLIESDRPTTRQILLGGNSDTQWGTDAWLMGIRNPQRDNFGNNARTTSQRRRRIHIDFDDKNNL